MKYKIEVWTGTKWYSLLFPGDLENWLYLISKYPYMLKSDFYKATHHGGRVYIGKKEAQDEVVQAIRPDIAVISANGRHKLPRNKTRSSLLRWSSNVFCTQKRCCEHFSIDGSIPVDKECCLAIYNCKSGASRISFKIEQNRIFADSQSCYGTFPAQSYPIIQFEQHLIPDSNVLTFLSESEIEKHTKWLVKKLSEIHLERIANIDSLGSRPIDVREIYDRALQENRFLTMSQIREIFEYGYSKNKFWAGNESDYWRNTLEYAYIKPTIADIKSMWELIQSYDILFFNISDFQKGVNSNVLSMHRNLLCDNIKRKTAFPSQLVDSYCWPLLSTKFLKGYKGYYIKYKLAYAHKNQDKWIMIVKNKKDYAKIIRDEMLAIYKKNDYVDEYILKNYAKKYFNGESNINICGTINVRHSSMEEVVKETISWLKDLFCDHFYRDEDDMLIINIW